MKKFELVVLVFICLVVAACGKDSDSVSSVRVAYFPNITHAQALVMKGEGILEKKLGGIKIEWRHFNAGPAEIDALFSGEIDIGYIGPVPAISGYVKSGGGLRIIAAASNGGSALVVRKGSGINTVADLRGKTIAIPQFGNTQHLSLLSLLHVNNLSLLNILHVDNLRHLANNDMVKVVQASNADIVKLMDKGRIDAALVPEPWGSIMELEYGADVLLDYDKVDARGIPSTAVVIVARDFLDKHRGVVEKFMEAHREATLYINENPSAREIVNAQIAEVTQDRINADILESAFKRLEITYQIPSESIMNFAKTGVDENLIPELPEANIIDDSFLKNE
ncbi:MAG: aliphatic sulfonate ABC transporter substrate-binding protein [Zoogloeaceae bacterium]|jgi:NitT/TauT family transport system substrate-binding protein|nr:aliphatic sulfonate ABC transporter substrate-binding protein [Zoogloeaceae bacterium]